MVQLVSCVNGMRDCIVHLFLDPVSMRKFDLQRHIPIPGLLCVLYARWLSFWAFRTWVELRPCFGAACPVFPWKVFITICVHVLLVVWSGPWFLRISSSVLGLLWLLHGATCMGCTAAWGCALRLVCLVHPSVGSWDLFPTR